MFHLPIGGDLDPLPFATPSTVLPLCLINNTGCTDSASRVCVWFQIPVIVQSVTVSRIKFMPVQVTERTMMDFAMGKLLSVINRALPEGYTVWHKLCQSCQDIVTEGCGLLTCLPIQRLFIYQHQIQFVTTLCRFFNNLNPLFLSVIFLTLSRP